MIGYLYKISEKPTDLARRVVDDHKTRREWIAAPWPLIVLSDNTFSLLGWAIRHAQRRQHQAGYYQHVMVLFRRGTVASQEFSGLTRLPLSQYMQGSHRLKAWHNPDWPSFRVAAALRYIRRRLDAPWYRRLYDPLSILGQWLGLPWLQCPGLNNCSEFAAEVLRILEPEFDLKNPTPSQINSWCQKHLVLWGRYDPER